MLGIREKHLYGTQTYEDLIQFIQEKAKELNVEVEIFQSNHEGALVDKIQAAYGTVDGIVINPAAYTHTSVAILDALKAVSIPAAEVHLTDVTKREPFRQISYAGMACQAHFIGLGFAGYAEALAWHANRKTE
jgi:3-dehydroquinate dehydratase-2